MKTTIGILALVACAGVASASVSSSTVVDSVTFNNIASIDAQGDVDNILGTWGNTGSGTVNAVRAFGSLTRNQAGTFASEARVRISAINNNTFGAFTVQASTTGSYTGTIAVDRTVSVTPFNLVSNGVAFEWFESLQDGTAGLAESTWDTVTYEFLNNTITNGNFALGTLNPGASVSTSGSHVSGGLDFFTFTISDDVNGGGYLNIRMLGGATGGMTDTEIALYDAGGNLISTDDDGSGTTLFSMMSFGTADPLATGSDDLPGSDGVFLAAGTYTLVTGGYNTNFTPLMSNIVAGTNTGTYDLSINYVPTPGALALLGMGGLIANRRRR